MQKVRRTRRESIIKREANISTFASQKKNPGFLETPQRRKKGMKQISSEQRAIPTDTMALYFGFQKSDKINSCGFNPIQFVVMFIAADGN